MWTIERRRRMPYVRPDQRSGWYSWAVVTAAGLPVYMRATREEAVRLASWLTRRRGGRDVIQHRAVEVL